MWGIPSMADGQGCALGSGSIPDAAALPGFGLSIQTFQVKKASLKDRVPFCYGKGVFYEFWIFYRGRTFVL